MDYAPSMSPEAVAAKTGKTWTQWFQLLDRWGAADKGHTASAAWLQERHEVPGWWAQNITVEYERARGLRQVGQKSDGGFEVSTQRTVAAPLDRLKRAWTEATQRRRWLNDPELRAAMTTGMRKARTSTTKQGDSVRLSLPDHSGGTQALQLVFVAKDKERSVVQLAHTKIPDKAKRDQLKARWSEALDAMKGHLEG